MKQYLDMVRHVMENGVDKEDRTGTGTRSVFGYQTRFRLRDGFPLLTTKRVFLKGIIHELLWFLAGGTNIRYLTDNGVHIWDDWADKETGDVGPIYGYQWRSWPAPDGSSIDQISNVIHALKTRPDDRRIIVSAWNVAAVEGKDPMGPMALPPCHAFFQFYSAPLRAGERLELLRETDADAADTILGACSQIPAETLALDNEDLAHDLLDDAGVPRRALSCQLYQRSADGFIGVPFNIGSYAILTMMVAQVTDHALGDFVHTFGDLHIYRNHFEQIQEQLTREPRALPKLKINPAVKDIFSFRYEDFELVGYDPHPAIKGAVAV